MIRFMVFSGLQCAWSVCMRTHNMRARECVCVCVCQREKERERETESWESHYVSLKNEERKKNQKRSSEAPSWRSFFFQRATHSKTPYPLEPSSPSLPWSAQLLYLKRCTALLVATPPPPLLPTSAGLSRLNSDYRSFCPLASTKNRLRWMKWLLENCIYDKMWHADLRSQQRQQNFNKTFLA